MPGVGARRTATGRVAGRSRDWVDTVIEARQLTKRYGGTAAVDDLSFVAEDGKVTGFLGPNGAGKSTTMRMVLGLDRADAGAVRIDGKRLVDFARPMRHVGALLDAAYVHPTRKAADHLWALAASNGLPKARAAATLELVGLTDVAGQRVGGYSLGMKQRLGLAAAMLGDPRTLIFDEPANGLDPEGILWMRRLLQRLAADGRTVFVSSHQLSEMALVADELVVIGRGRLIFQGPAHAFVDGATSSWVRVRSPQLPEVVGALEAEGATVTSRADGAVDVTGASARDIGELAARLGATLHELSPQQGSLEEAFLQVTADAQDYRSAAVPPERGPA